MNSQLIVNNDLKSAMIERYGNNEFLFDFTSIICLMLRYDGHLYVFAYRDEDDDRDIYLYDRLPLSICDDNVISNDTLLVGELLIIDDKHILIRSKRYEGVDIETFISEPNFSCSRPGNYLYLNSFTSHDVMNAKDFLPMIMQ